jgi:hypothetical protein
MEIAGIKFADQFKSGAPGNFLDFFGRQFFRRPHADIFFPINNQNLAAGFQHSFCFAEHRADVANLKQQIGHQHQIQRIRRQARNQFFNVAFDEFNVLQSRDFGAAFCRR